MNATTRRAAVFLTCAIVASSAAAQDTNRNQDTNKDGKRQAERVLRQRENETRRGQAQGQRRGATRGRSSQAEITEGFSRTVRLAPGGTFDLLSGAGDVTINGGGGREARIEAIKRVRDTVGARARTAINQVRIDVAERGGNVEVRTIQPPGPSRVTVEYTISVPENVNLILRSTSGNLQVQNISGDELSANTLSGRIILRALASRMLELHTVSGNMELHDIATRRAIVQSTLGNLEFTGRLQPTGRYRLQTHSGNIRFVPSGDPDFDFEARTFNGQLQSDFPLLKAPAPAERMQRRPLKTIRTTVGNAGATVTAVTFSGNVVIVKP